jgi:hypothetical protein
VVGQCVENGNDATMREEDGEVVLRQMNPGAIEKRGPIESNKDSESLENP